MQPTFRRVGLIGLMLISLLLGLTGGLLLDRQTVIGAAPDTGKPDFHLMNEAWDLIQGHYVDRDALKSQELTYGAISGMVNALGDTGHTTFLTPEMVKQERNFTQGAFEGIGAEVEERDGHIVIAAPMDNSPAQQAGLRPGDIILAVDGADVSGQTLDQVVTKVIGPAGSQVTLTLQDPDTGQKREVTLTRARITLTAVTWQLLPNTTVAHVRISAFSDKVSENLQIALAAAKKAGATAIVLDLRNNPGGLLDQAVGVASQFLKDGIVLQEKNAQGVIKQTSVLTDVPKTDAPMVVLTNAGSASAAEIVAGALQDTGRAVILGEKTFGTGTVLNEFPLSDGSAIMIAVQEWLTPNGRTIWHQGIEPDQVVELPQTVSPLLPAAEQGMTAAQLRASGDAQLLAALDRLTKAGAGTRQTWPGPGVWPGSQAF